MHELVRGYSVFERCRAAAEARRARDAREARRRRADPDGGARAGPSAAPARKCVGRILRVRARVRMRMRSTLANRPAYAACPHAAAADPPHSPPPARPPPGQWCPAPAVVLCRGHAAHARPDQARTKMPDLQRPASARRSP